ncbi:unnamed protein product [Allacma fusca]|uniref:MPN domain-containing protein n=1 Tax=Allacma fusca TaxID=39272 RepID=A0A8J2LM63_9HEXA|nr:unnamed protein product [Allacma fusca]
MERLQPFSVKISADALALADFHANITNTETIGYISGHWNGDQNALKLEVVHPCHVLMPLSSSTDCDNERNRIALEIQKLGHEVVGWYHSHPKAPAQPSKDDINRQLDYQVMMKGATESSYIPCVGLIIAPMCYTNQGMKKSKVQLFWVMPPPENRPMEMGRPMHLDYDTISASNLDTKKMLLSLESLLNYYKENKTLVDINDISSGKFEKLKETVSSWIPELKTNVEFWNEVKHLFTCPLTPATKTEPVEITGNSLELPVSIKQEETDSIKTQNSTCPDTSPTHSTNDPMPSTSILPVSGPSSASSTSRSVSTPSSTGEEPGAT